MCVRQPLDHSHIEHILKFSFLFSQSFLHVLISWSTVPLHGVMYRHACTYARTTAG